MGKRLNSIFRRTIILGAALSLSACNGIFEGIYDGSADANMEVKPGHFSQVKTTEYTEWVYIDLSTPKATTVKIGKEYDDEIPKKWDFAIHRYDIKTNEGGGYQTSYTGFDELKAAAKLPEEKSFMRDVWTTDKIAVDISGMMDGKIVYTESYRNPILSGWLHVDLSTMPPVYTLSSRVFLLLLKDKTYAAIRFTNYMSAKGEKGYIDFDYIYPFNVNEK